MQDLAAAEGVTGIESILGTLVDPMLPVGELDWVIIADVYHEMSDPEPMLAGIRRALAPGGQVALLEYRVEDGTGDSIKADHTMSVRQVLLEWTAAGFELAALHDFLPGQHLFFFRSADGAHGTPAVTEHDLLDALDAGVVEAEAIGDDTDTVKIRIRRTGALGGGVSSLRAPKTWGCGRRSPIDVNLSRMMTGRPSSYVLNA